MSASVSSVTPVSSVSSLAVTNNTIIVNGIDKQDNTLRAQGPSPASTSSDKSLFLSSVTEETNSSVSSFHSNELSDSAVSLSSSTIGESPNKYDPLDVGLLPSVPMSSTELRNMSSSSFNGLPSHLQETVTMSIDEVMQYAQPIADFTF